MSAASGLARIVGKFGGCNLAPANILLDAFLPLCGSYMVPTPGDLHYGFDYHEENDGYYTPAGWMNASNQLVAATAYSPLLPLKFADLIHTAATTHGDKRIGRRFLRCQIDIEDSLHPGLGESGWTGKDENNEDLPDVGMFTKRKHRLTWDWDPQQDPEQYIYFEAKTDFGESGDWTVWRTWGRNADGTATNWESAIAWGMMEGYHFGGHCNPNNWATALTWGGSAVVTWLAGPGNNEVGLDVAYTIAAGQTNAGAYSFKLRITKSMMLSPEPGPTDDPPSWISLHDQVQGLLDGIDLTDLTRIYDFNESVGGVGTPKSVQLSPGNMYYMLPFWKVDPGTGLRSTERMFDLIRVPLAIPEINWAEVCPYDTGPYGDLWLPHGDWGVYGLFGALVPGGYRMVANLGIGWGYDRSIEGFSQGGSGWMYGCGFDRNLLFKIQRRLRVRDWVEFPGLGGEYDYTPANLLRSTVERPTFHLTKARIVEPVQCCGVVYASDFGTEPGRWPTEADPDDGGAEATDVGTINDCRPHVGTGSFAVDWRDINLAPAGNVDRGMLVLMRYSQVPVQIWDATNDIYGPMCLWGGEGVSRFVHWPECCTEEEGVEP